ncbi:galactonate dehydratase [Bradyrhizobium sp. USDA 4461]
MKIERVAPRRVGQFLFCEISASNGLAGYGESGAWGHLEASEAALLKFAHYLEGKDPRTIEAHWQVMHRFSHHNGSAVGGAISAIDMALWDLKAKSLGVPLYELLGGKVRDKIRVYAHASAETSSRIASHARSKIDAGFTAIGHVNPLLDEPEDRPLVHHRTSLIRMGLDTVREVRTAVGNDIDLLLELHRRLTPAEAIGFAQGVSEYLPAWIEDPIKPDDVDAMAEVAKRSPVPIATGERFHSIYQFKAAIERRALSYARVSLGICGGITGAMKVAAIAEANEVQLAPHNPISPVGLAACAAIAFSRPCVWILEYPTGLENFVFETSDAALGANVVDSDLIVRDGYMLRSDRPGLGVSVLHDAEQIRSPITRHVSMRPHIDGGLVDH